MIGSSFGDPVLGVDVHFEMVPTPAPVPTPIPNPFTGVVFDPVGLAVGLAIGAAVSAVLGAPIQGPVMYWTAFPATNTGTEAKHVPGHIIIPPGTAWAPFPKTPKPVIHPGETPAPALPVKPEDDAVVVFGSKTVTVMGSNAVRLGDIALSCSEPVRLPSSVVLAVPKGAPILIGGPPSLDIMAAIMASLRTRFVSDSLHAALSRLKPSRFRNFLHRAVCFFTGHPVDVASGKVMTEAIEAELPGPLPLTIERLYSSAFASRRGPLGHGWSLSLDQAVWRERGRVVLLAEDGRELEFDTFDFPRHRIEPGQQVYNPVERLTLHCERGDRYRVVGPDGVTREFSPVAGRSDGRAMITEMRSRCGRHRITYQYDEHGRLVWVRDSGGRAVGLTWDAHGRVTSLSLPSPHDDGRIVHRRYAYDEHGDLVQVTDSLGNPWRFGYATHLLTAETDRNGLSFYFQYDGLGEDARCVRTWGDDGVHDHVLVYDKGNRVTFVTDSRGFSTRYSMNLVGLVEEIVDPLGGTTRYEYDPETLMQTARVDANEGRTEWTYDARGNLVEVVEPDGARETIEYDGTLPVRAVDARGGEARWRYSGGLLVERTLPGGQTTTYGWSDGLLISATSGGQRTELGYDGQKNLVSMKLPNGAVERIRCDGQGRPTVIRHPLDGETTIERDTEGRPTKVRSPADVIQKITRAPEGNVLELRSPTRHVRLGYDGNQRVAWREEGGIRLLFEWNREQQLTAVVNEAGERHVFELDGNGRVVAETGFDGRTRTYLRDATGQVTKALRPSGRSSETEYDPCGRPLRVQHDDGTFVRYAYAPGGDLVEAENESGTVVLVRDDSGRVIGETFNGFRGALALRRTGPAHPAADVSRGAGCHRARSHWGGHGDVLRRPRAPRPEPPRRAVRARRGGARAHAPVQGPHRHPVVSRQGGSTDCAKNPEALRAGRCGGGRPPRSRGAVRCRGRVAGGRGPASLCLEGPGPRLVDHRRRPQDDGALRSRRARATRTGARRRGRGPAPHCRRHRQRVPDRDRARPKLRRGRSSRAHGRDPLRVRRGRPAHSSVQPRWRTMATSGTATAASPRSSERTACGWPSPTTPWDGGWPSGCSMPQGSSSGRPRTTGTTTSSCTSRTASMAS